MAAVVNGVPVAIPPPENYKVDFDNPQRNTVPAAYWLFGVGNVFALLFMLQRVYVRAMVQKLVRVEDGKCSLFYFVHLEEHLQMKNLFSLFRSCLRKWLNETIELKIFY